MSLSLRHLTPPLPLLADHHFSSASPPSPAPVPFLPQLSLWRRALKCWNRSFIPHLSPTRPVFLLPSPSHCFSANRDRPRRPISDFAPAPPPLASAPLCSPSFDASVAAWSSFRAPLPNRRLFGAVKPYRNRAPCVSFRCV